MSLLEIDEKISRALLLHRQKRPGLDRVAVGAAKYLIFVAVGTALFERGLTAIPILLAAWAVTLTLESVFRRRRPFQALRHKPLASYWVPTSSFPSAHATWSFACAAMVWSVNPVGGGCLLLIALIISWARVYVGVHYLSDVAAGAVVGAGTAWLAQIIL
jgi:undecaprenyl-diphosphatase